MSDPLKSRHLKRRSAMKIIPKPVKHISDTPSEESGVLSVCDSGAELRSPQ